MKSSKQQVVWVIAYKLSGHGTKVIFRTRKAARDYLDYDLWRKNTYEIIRCPVWD
jgi:hypothetical protein